MEIEELKKEKKYNFENGLKGFLEEYEMAQNSLTSFPRHSNNCGNQARKVSEAFCRYIILKSNKPDGQKIHELEGALSTLQEKVTRSANVYIEDIRERDVLKARLKRILDIGNEASHDNSIVITQYDLNEIKNNLLYFAEYLFGQRFIEERKKYVRNLKLQESEEIKEYPFHRKIEKDKYICQKGKVSIEAKLPKVDFPMSFLINCEVLFKLENNKTIIITLDNEVTLKELFSLDWYICNEYNESDKETISYTLNSITLETSKETFNILIKIANDLQEVYTEKINQLEEKLESKGFDLSKEYENGFELCEISYKLFIKIQYFMKKHIMYKTSNRGKWDIFMDSNSSYFIWTKDIIINTRVKYVYDIEVEEPIRIILVWDTLNFYSAREDEVKILTVKESYIWLMEELIGTIKEEILRDIEIDSIQYYDIMDEYFNITDLYYESEEKYKNKEFIAIHKIVNSLYSFNKSIISNKNNLKILYEGLILLLENSKRLDINGLRRLFYYIGNINTIPVLLKNEQILNPTKEYFINRINIELDEIKKGDMSMKELIGDITFSLREIINCYMIIFDLNSEDTYPFIVIHEIYKKLQSFEKVSNIYSVRDKMMMPFKFDAISY